MADDPCICGGRTFLHVDEKKPDGSFGPGPLERCVNCKVTRPVDDPGASGVKELEPVAWRWRYMYARGPGQWTVRQSPVEPQEAGSHCVASEVEPLYTASALASLAADNEKLREALTPSGDTKAAYHGEFVFTMEDVDEDGQPTPRKVYVPWTTVKEIMTAIRDRALKGQKP
jgi:hypothetical protein